MGLISRYRRGRAAVGLVTAAFLGAFVGCNQSATSGSGATTGHAGTSSHRGAATAFGGSIPTFAPAPAPEPITLSRSGSVAPIFQRLPIHQRVAFLTTIVPQAESLEVVRPTLEAATKIRYEGQLDIWLLDELAN